MNKKVIEKKLDKIQDLVYKVYSAVDVCINSSAYKDESEEDILIDARDRLEEIIEIFFQISL